MTELRTDLIPESLTEPQKVLVGKLTSTVLTNLRMQKGSGSSYLPQGDRSRQPREAKDLDGALSLIAQSIEDRQTTESVPVNQRIVFSAEYPLEPIETEGITHTLIRRQPGAVSPGAAFEGEVHEMKPHIRDERPDPLFPGKVVFTMGQKFDNEIVLICWAKTNKQANKRARWLEDTLRDYTWFIKYNGVEEFFFMGQGEDMALNTGSSSNIVFGRPLHYFVRTERITNLSEETIRRIFVNLGIGSTE